MIVGGSKNFKDDDFNLSILFNRIVDSGIAVTGPNASFIPEISPFYTFYQDIFEFEDIEMVRELKADIDYLLTADKYFKNFCNVEKRISNDLLHFVENIECANDIMSSTSLLDDIHQYMDRVMLIY